MTPNIEIRNLSVCFETPNGSVRAVHDLSTTFYAGRISGIIGESGSGKSIMGMSILQLLPNTAKVSGSCLFGAHELYSMSPKQLRQIRGAMIGLIPQNPNASLNPVMKIKDQIIEAVLTHGHRNRKKAAQHAADLLRQFGFQTPESILNQYAFQMSGGMNQRLVSVLGLACQPGWIIADEPTKGLDAVVRNQVYTVLRKIHLQYESSMIVITHDLELAHHLCDDIRVLYQGQLVEQGPAKLVMEQPLHPLYSRAAARHAASRYDSNSGSRPCPKNTEWLCLLSALLQGRRTLRTAAARRGFPAAGQKGKVLSLCLNCCRFIASAAIFHMAFFSGAPYKPYKMSAFLSNGEKPLVWLATAAAEKRPSPV